MICAILATAAITSAAWYHMMRKGEKMLLLAALNHMEKNGCPPPSPEEMKAGIREARRHMESGG